MRKNLLTILILLAFSWMLYATLKESKRLDAKCGKDAACKEREVLEHR